MILVFILLAILIIITLFVFLIVASNLKISLQNFYVSNINEDDKKTMIEYNNAIKNDFSVKISLVLFNKIPWIFIKLNKEKIKLIAKKVHFDKTTLRKLEKDFKVDDIKKIKGLSPKISELNLNIEFGLDDVVITSYLVVVVSTIISNVLPFLVEKENYNRCVYDVKPIYLNKNLYKISLNCIIEEKMVHIINILYKFLKKGRSDKHERTSNRRSYDNSNEQFAKYG